LDWVLAIGLWTLLFGAILTISGLAILFALLRGARPNASILAGSFACGLFFLALFGLSRIDGKGPNFKEMQGYLEENLQAQMAALKSQGMTQDNIDENMEWAEKYGVQAYPAWLSITCVWFGFISYYMVPILFRRFSPRIPRPMPFRQWIIPEPLIFGPIVGALFKISLKYFNLPDDGWEDVLGSNLLIFFGCLYILGGFSIIAYYLQKYNVPMVFRFPFYVIMTILYWPLLILGILDVWMDWRKIKTPPLEKTA
jgi:uncharacterized protein YybS (DUF2232 family)